MSQNQIFQQHKFEKHTAFESLPLECKTVSHYNGCIDRYWSAIDEVIREAVVLRSIRVRLLISFWKKTHPLTFNFVSSLKSLCMQLLNCSLEVVRECTQLLQAWFVKECRQLLDILLD